MSELDKGQIKAWYNDYVGSQENIGINIRHRTIIQRAIKEGLRSDSKVLEVGCGIGTLTKLLCDVVNKGSVLAADISDESIKTAGKRLSSYKNLELLVSDMSDFSREEQFDYFVFPDVLEHIPVEQHGAIFQTIAKHSHSKSKVLINIPDPTWLEYMIKNKPEVLQVIDQPIHSDLLTKNAYAAGWKVDQINSYKLFHEVYDYQFIIFSRNEPLKEVPKRSKWEMKKDDLKSKFL